MTGIYYAILSHRGVIAVSGEDRQAFLQGLISNDIAKAAPDRAIHAAFLTAQGKFLHDFFIIETGGTLLLDCEADRLDDLKKRLSMYRLRSKVSLEDVNDRYSVAVLYGEGVLDKAGLKAEAGAAKAIGDGVVFVDPRLSTAGARAILPKENAEETLRQAGFEPGDPTIYDKARISLGLPDGSRDMVVEKSILLENGFDELGSVDWHKGCYLGQELTARTKYRGLVRKRLMPVTLDGPAPATGTPIMAGDKEAGEIRSVADDIALAMIRLEALEDGGDLMAGKTKVTPSRPDWMAG